MSAFSADNLLAAAAVWIAIMLPSAAFGNDPVREDVAVSSCNARPAQAGSGNVIPDSIRAGFDRAA
ncbi:hypothetical protein OSH10_01725 [Kaistia defluvii]|uniref:hypothetical protein n=1 Tax=Kaistia defluvii TaxID=410841 RepID=UPI00225BDC88|nr:hypothetical protein [Kaistia defluvii]MCX5517140.1 hypothetical protein [Kaistia defluvii]